MKGKSSREEEVKQYDSIRKRRADGRVGWRLAHKKVVGMQWWELSITTQNIPTMASDGVAGLNSQSISWLRRRNSCVALQNFGRPG